MAFYIYRYLTFLVA